MHRRRAGHCDGCGEFAEITFSNPLSVLGQWTGSCAAKDAKNVFLGTRREPNGSIGVISNEIHILQAEKALLPFGKIIGKIFRPTRKSSDRTSLGSEQVITAVDRHITKYVGEVAAVLHEIQSPTVHVDLHVVEPTDDRPYITLVTSGMSELPMKVPEEFSDGAYAELMISLPSSWPMTAEAVKDERAWWPMRLLKGLARYPHDFDTWLYCGHSMQWDEEAKPFAENTRMNSVILLPPKLLPPEASIIDFGNGRIGRLWAVVPIYPEELSLKLENGFEKMDSLFDTYKVTELLDAQRMSVAGDSIQ